MKEFLDKTRKALSTKVDSLIAELESGMKMVTDVVSGLPVFVSLERFNNEQQFDEKHYFVIPYKLSDKGFSLHTMRLLPEGALEVNELPKRRIFHFPNEYYEGTLREHMLSTAREMAYDNADNNVSSLEKLANDIDKLDSKLTYGMLFIGGLAAVFNPVLGAAIAAKALLPSLTGLLSKYSLRSVGEKLSQFQLEKKAKEAEKYVLKQFSEASTLRVINPVLARLEYALRTNQEQYDPLHSPNIFGNSIKELDEKYWQGLTETAIYHVYQGIYEAPEMHESAGLGDEDIRWFDVLFAGLKER